MPTRLHVLPLVSTVAPISSAKTGIELEITRAHWRLGGVLLIQAAGAMRAI